MQLLKTTQLTWAAMFSKSITGKLSDCTLTQNFLFHLSNIQQAGCYSAGLDKTQFLTIGTQIVEVVFRTTGITVVDWVAGSNLDKVEQILPA